MTFWISFLGLLGGRGTSHPLQLWSPAEYEGSITPRITSGRAGLLNVSRVHLIENRVEGVPQPLHHLAGSAEPLLRIPRPAQRLPHGVAQCADLQRLQLHRGGIAVEGEDLHVRNCSRTRGALTCRKR